MRRKIDPDKKVKLSLTDGDEIILKVRDVMVPPGKKVSLAKDYEPGFTGGFKAKKQASEALKRNVGQMAEMQARLYAQDSYSVLLVFQAMDAAGKDGAIKHVMSGVNPQGCHVTSFKKPSANELDHDYLWRINKALPGRGMIGIFNRSYYEEVLVTRVHPGILDTQRLPGGAGKGIWEDRYRQLNDYERYLSENGVVVIKFFLNLSKEEQRQRFLARIDEKEKNWKFSIADVTERVHWDEYQKAYEECFRNTSTPWAPWFVIPADHKWFSRLAISEIVLRHLRALDLQFPKVTKERRAELLEIRKGLEAEAPKGAKKKKKKKGKKGKAAEVEPEAAEPEAAEPEAAASVSAPAVKKVAPAAKKKTVPVRRKSPAVKAATKAPAKRAVRKVARKIVRKTPPNRP